MNRATLEALGLNDETEVNVRVADRCLIIEPTASHRARVREATERVIADHAVSLRKLSK
jgi:antitoxin component of MazEF toxin-antitoxin module